MQTDQVQNHIASWQWDAPAPLRRRSKRTLWNTQGRGINVEQVERMVSIASGVILAITGVTRRSLAGIFTAGVGAGLIHRGVTGHCYAYQALGMNTNRKSESEEGLFREIAERGIHVEQAMLINRPADQLYRFWRNFENLPAVMTHLELVRVTDDRRSHWIAKAPAIAGGRVEWSAEITRDEPNSVIGWRSMPGSDIDCVGEIRFQEAKGDRGTEVHVYMEYVPPAGRVGHWMAKLFGESPREQIREDLRNFKRLMEVGEIPTTQGQPRGTCTGVGKFTA